MENKFGIFKVHKDDILFFKELLKNRKVKCVDVTDSYLNKVEVNPSLDEKIYKEVHSSKLIDPDNYKVEIIIDTSISNFKQKVNLFLSENKIKTTNYVIEDKVMIVFIEYYI